MNRLTPVPYRERCVYAASNTTTDLLDPLGALHRTGLTRAENEAVSAILAAVEYRFPDKIGAEYDPVLSRPAGREPSVFDRPESLASQIIAAIPASR